MKRLDRDYRELIAAANGGDEQAMEEVIEDFRPVAKSLARVFFLTGGDGDDVIQEGMIGLYKAIRTYDAEKNDNFPAYAVLCMRRAIQSAVKAANRDKNKPLNDYTSLENVTTASPVDSMLAREQARELGRIVSTKLNQIERRILELFLQGDSYAEIAKKTGFNVKKVDNTLQRIKTKVRMEMQ